ncbi:MAG: class I SAM-dependent methyltransferase [Clostridiales bacterium]|jgi:tRNA A22 N-methylase|nr:class I SAM-dependent methyltransferase [Clostridiales bacterium]
MKNIDKRLEAILLGLYGDSVCDIGTDHGKLPALAILRGIVTRAIATDISPNSLKKAKELYRTLGISEYVETRIGDGLDVVLWEEADTFVMAGMGGYTIVGILSKGVPPVGKHFVFAPHQDAAPLREYLLTNGYILFTDRVTESGGKYYDIFTAVYDGNICTEKKLFSSVYFLGAKGDTAKQGLFLEYGRDNLLYPNEDFLKKLAAQKNEFDKALERVYNIECAKKAEQIEEALRFYSEKKITK